MKRTLVLSLVTGLAVTACESGSGAQETVEPQPTVTVTETVQAAETLTPSSPASPASSPSGAEEPSSTDDADETTTGTFRTEMLIGCNPEDSNSWWDDDAATLEEIWELPAEERYHCRYPERYSSNWEPTEDELAAVGADGSYEDLERSDQGKYENRITDGYLRCGSSQFRETSYEEYRSSAEAIERAMSLCPDHPEIEYGEERLEAATQAEQQADQQREVGTRFGDGRRQVGEEVQPGSYFIEGNIGDCYWETLDNAGNIIANNFVHSAQRVEAYISPEAYTFRSSGCGTEWQPF